MRPVTDGGYVQMRLPSTAACIAAHIIIESSNGGTLESDLLGPNTGYRLNYVLYQLQLLSIAACGVELFDCDFVANSHPQIPDLGIDIFGISGGGGALPKTESFGYSDENVRRIVSNRLSSERIAFIDTMIRMSMESAKRKNLISWCQGTFPFEFIGDGTPYKKTIEIASGKYGETKQKALRYVKREEASWDNVNRPVIPRRMLFEQVELTAARSSLSLLD